MVDPIPIQGIEHHGNYTSSQSTPQDAGKRQKKTSDAPNEIDEEPPEAIPQEPSPTTGVGINVDLEA